LLGMLLVHAHLPSDPKNGKPSSTPTSEPSRLKAQQYLWEASRQQRAAAKSILAREWHKKATPLT
ncbi:MAG: hypothetical protein M3O00_06550, partial [Pseudomonadota bacterium]|nr:hypothetical protein [Pseudomonadota bacterium]